MPCKIQTAALPCQKGFLEGLFASQCASQNVKNYASMETLLEELTPKGQHRESTTYSCGVSAAWATQVPTSHNEGYINHL